MCNKGMRGRHWGQISEVVGYDITPDSGTTLRKMLRLDLAPYMEQFENISAAATKVNIACVYGKIFLSFTSDQLETENS